MTHALIIDDNANNVAVLSALLTMEEIDHSSIDDPRKLESFLESEWQFDIVFLDLEMPGLDGYVVCEQLRSDVRFSDVPIVAYTVHINEIQVALEKGFHSFIGKPLDVDQFPEQIARILAGERIWVTP